MDLSLPSVLNLNIENVFTPASTLENSIGFQTVNGTTLTGSMNIGLTNVMVTPPNGTATPLTSANAATRGKSDHQRRHVNVTYASRPSLRRLRLCQRRGPQWRELYGRRPVAPGSIASVFGSGFGSSSAGVTVLIGGIVAPLFAVTPQQINFQVPWQLSGQTQAALTVTSGDLTSAPITVPLAHEAPGIFLLNSAGQAAVLVANTAVGRRSRGDVPRLPSGQPG